MPQLKEEVDVLQGLLQVPSPHPLPTTLSLRRRRRRLLLLDLLQGLLQVRPHTLLLLCRRRRLHVLQGLLHAVREQETLNSAPAGGERGEGDREGRERER